MEPLYYIKIGKQYLMSPLVCKPGGAQLTPDIALAGKFPGKPEYDSYGQSMTVGLARNLLSYSKRAFVKPVAGGPGRWVW